MYHGVADLEKSLEIGGSAARVVLHLGRLHDHVADAAGGGETIVRGVAA